MGSTSTWNTAKPEDIRRGATIRALREAYGLTRDQLGKAAEVSGNYIAHIETGHRAAPLILCRKIADTLKVPLAAITVEDYDSLDAPQPTYCTDGDAA